MELILLAAGALLVRLAQTVGAMGMGRAKNVASGGIRSIADLCLATIMFWALGAAIVFQTGNNIFGIHVPSLIGWRGISASFFGMLVMVLIATGIFASALAERSKFRVPLSAGALLAGLVVPIVANWVWFGWLAELGFIDQAGAAPIHLAPAIFAMIAVLAVGPRDGKYNRDGSSNMIPGHSVLMILLSVMLMLVGWVPYVLIRSQQNPVMAGSNVLIAAAAGGLISMLVSHLRFGKVDVILTCSGILGGLVSVTASAGIVGTPVAFLIGLVAGVIIPWAMIKLDVTFKIDDPGGVIAIHGIGAIWSLLAAGLFAPAVSMAARLQNLGVQALGIAVITTTTLIFAIALMGVLRSIGVRAKEADEYDGLDLAEHDINAHPDFQQTMIKSYHLREA